MDDSSGPAARFLELTRSNEQVRGALDNALLSEALDERPFDSLLEVSVEIGRQNGFDFTADDLRHALEVDLAMDDEVVVADDLDAGTDAGTCKSNSGCRTPCVYCKPDEILGEEPAVILPE